MFRGKKVYNAVICAAFALAALVDAKGGEAANAAVRFVDAYDLSAASCGRGARVCVGKTTEDGTLLVHGKRYARGFCARPESAVAFQSDGRVIAFDAKVGIDDASKSLIDELPAACFRIWADERIVFTSGDVRRGQQPVVLHVDLKGAREIVLETRGCGPDIDSSAALADWLDASFECEPDAVLEPVSGTSRYAQLGVQTPPERPEPKINGADIWGVRPGHPVIFRVATTGRRPMRFSSRGLPEGVTLDARGVLRGTAPAAGDYDIVVMAENAYGKAERTIRLAVGDWLSLTPPMGWNSWNTLCYRLTQEKAEAAARAMEASGLGNHGWSYVNLDDWWNMNTSGCHRAELRKSEFGGRDDVMGPVRDARGKVLPNRSFTDMRALTDAIHDLGFKAGIYSSPGALTCGLCEGSLGHEGDDAESWAEWGFDYVKYDWCSYVFQFEKETGKRGDFFGSELWGKPQYHEHFVKPYRIMGEALARQNRDIVFSFCQYGIDNVGKWGDRCGGNCFRTWRDMKDGWAWMELALEGHDGADVAFACSRPGWWGDPDMLIVGQQYSFGFDHPSLLTPNEQYTHVSLWAMVGAPLLIGCDLTKMDEFTRNLLANDEVIAVSQDRLGKVARRIRHTDAESVWKRPLVKGFIAVALVNRYPLSREIRVSFKELGLPGTCWVKDLWRQRCEGKHSGEYIATVPPHATKLVKVRPEPCLRCE